MGTDSWTSVAAEPGGSCSRHGTHDAGSRRHFTDGVVDPIRNVHVARSVQSDAARKLKGRTGGLSVITRVRWRSGSGHRRDDAGRHRHFTDAVVVGIHNINVARGVKGHSVRII